MREVTQARYDRDHEVFTPLDGEAVLWRYMDLTKVLAILEDQALHFASADRLGDPFEGSLSVPMTLPPAYINDNGVIRPVSDQERQMFAQMAPSASKLTEAQRRWTYVSCWNHSEIELDALWGRYVRSDAGIAIRSSFRRLTMSFGPPLPARRERAEGAAPRRRRGASDSRLVGRVAYVDYATAAWPPGNTYWPYVHKRLSFQHENEVRAVISQWPTNENGIDFDAATPPGLNVAVDIRQLIEAIFVSPVAPEWLFDLVRRVCRERYSLDAPVLRSQLAGSPQF